jgi:ABC-type multidrug transport system ATPase subunit
MKRHFSSSRFKHLWDRPISNLTKGELHWVGMVLSLESDPRVLLIDEYGVHLTNEMEREFRSQLQKMNRRLGTTIIMSSPNEAVVKNFASVIIFLDNGHISKIRSSSSRQSNRSGRSDKRRRGRNNPGRRQRNYNAKHKKSGNN